MIEFKNLAVLQHASPQIQEQVRSEGKLQIAGREYHINAESINFFISFTYRMDF
ncbi:hypothetical protein [Photorhabdus akhurstii]|uniref:hypothetical protein n=1 Tax=Photorhabdus akhurstii TaxID=171438 RepID=UPI0015E37ACC